MATALDAARFLIYAAAAEDEPELLTNLRLQKLLYYAQGWYLAAEDRPLFPEGIEAWASGPVVPDVYAEFQRFGTQGIPYPEVVPAENLTPAEEQHLRDVWQSYREFSAVRLRELTHADAPWRDARLGLGPLDRGAKSITAKAMRAYFAPLLEPQP